MIKKYYLSSKIFTIQVNTIYGNICWTAPIAKKFIGQPLENLIKWSRADVVEELG